MVFPPGPPRRYLPRILPLSRGNRSLAFLSGSRQTRAFIFTPAGAPLPRLEDCTEQVCK